MFDPTLWLRRQINLGRFRRAYDASTAVDLSRVSEFRDDAFPHDAPDCWLDRPDAGDAIETRLKRGDIDPHQADALRFWVENGYLIVPKLIDDAMLDSTWAAYERALADGKLGLRSFANAAQTLDERKLDPHLLVPEIRALQHHSGVLAWADLLFGRKTIPFQTIMGHAGSQQAPHSDSIHMTTYPLGYLIANWVPFEDITPDSGPLEYYPRSHKLPYLLSKEAGIAPFEFKEKGYGVYGERYEPAIRRQCEDAGLEKKIFLANKGDVLFWHANLVHGGSPRIDDAKSRKALVCHYFAERAFTYHDLSGNPTRLHKNGVYAAPEIDNVPA
jgi:hypothetical protein